METIQFISTSPNALANLIDEKIKAQLDELKQHYTPKEPGIVTGKQIVLFP